MWRLEQESTLRLKVIVSTKAPPRPTCCSHGATAIKNHCSHHLSLLGHRIDDLGIVNDFIIRYLIYFLCTMLFKKLSAGELLNIDDTYSHPLFYRGVDDATGFRTR